MRKIHPYEIIMAGFGAVLVWALLTFPPIHNSWASLDRMCGQDITQDTKILGQTGMGKALGIAIASAAHTDYTSHDNCRGAWLFDDDLTDESGEGNTLTEAGDPAYSTTRPSGFTTGKSRDYDGTGDYDTRATGDLSINFPGSSKTGNPGSWTNMTVCFWVNRNQQNRTDGIIGKCNTWYIKAGWKTDNYNEADFNVRDSDGNEAGAIFADPLADDTWAHFCIVFQGGSTKYTVYENGDDGTDKTLTDIDNVVSNNWNSFYIGYDRNSGNNPMDGFIYQPIVFDTALSKEQCQEIYNYGITGEDERS